MTRSRDLFPIPLFIAFGLLLLFTEMPALIVEPTSGGLFVGARSVHDAVENFCLGAVNVAASRDAIVLLLVTAIPLGIAGLVATWSIVVQLVRSRRLASVLLANEVSSPPASLIRAATRAGLRGRVRLVASADFSAFCFGLMMPAAWVSTAALEALDPAELEAVLRHEAWHVRQRDPLRVLVANAGSAAVGLFPFVRRKTQAYLLNRELQADAAVVHDMGDPYPLASALRRAASVAQHPLPTAVGAFNSIDARIDQLLDGGAPGIGNGSGLRATSLQFVSSVAPTIVVCIMVTAI